jgi:hypothetical protein
MIKTLSPYYYETPFVSVGSTLTCTSYTLNLYIWTGDEASIPGTPQYTITKTNPTGATGSDYVNISRILADYIDFTPQDTTTSASINAVNQYWVRTEVVYTGSGGVEAAQYGANQLFNRAYTYGDKGGSVTTFVNNTLLQGSEFKADRTSVFCVPILIVKDTGSQLATIKSYPNNEINQTIGLPTTNNSAALVQVLWVKVSEATTDTYIEVVFDGVTTTLLIEDELKYTPLDICFQNKDGCQQFLTFRKERTDDINITSSEFESDRAQPSDGNHQFVTYNVQGREGFRVNSGWQDEALNETFKQLLLSERVWTYDGTDFIPVTIDTKQLTYKTQKKERLINYEIGFKYAYNAINNI